MTAGQSENTSNNESSELENKLAEDELLVERQRPSVIKGVTERVRTGHGNMFVTINYDENDEPFEVFIAVGKAGGCDSAQLEGISRLTTLALRAGIDPKQVVEHLRGITCCPVWDGGTLVRSAPDAVALVLSRHLNLDDESGTTDKNDSTTQLGMFGSKTTVTNGTNGHATGINANRCPECSVGSLIYQEGCKRCPDCGYNKCD